jgi:2-methylisocitrate lyase-like PEP mutase family enzyme
MRKVLAARRAAFRTLHESGHFVIPNPWDIGSARRLEKLGFKALAFRLKTAPDRTSIPCR